MEIITVVREMLCNNYRSRNLIGPYHFWGIGPRNSTSFTGLFLTWRRAWAGHETKISVAATVNTKLKGLVTGRNLEIQ